MGGAGNEGIGGGREKAGALALPAESVRGGGLFDADSLFCILRGPTVGVFGWDSDGRRNSSSSGRPCLRPSMAGQEPAMLYGRMRLCGEHARGKLADVGGRWFFFRVLFLATDAGTEESPVSRNNVCTWCAVESEDRGRGVGERGFAG